MGFPYVLVFPGSGATADVGTASERRLDPDARQCAEQVRQHAGADDRRDDDDGLFQRRAEMRFQFLLEVDDDEQRSGGSDRLADQDAKEQADDDRRRTTADRPRSTFEVLAARRAAGVEQTAKEARRAAKTEHDGIAGFDTAAAAAVIRHVSAPATEDKAVVTSMSNRSCNK